MDRTIVIAEIGENHLGNMDTAKKLIEKAAQARADYVKFQSYKPENFRKDDPEYDWFKRVALSDDAHFMLKECAESCGVRFLSSPFSVERAKFLCERLGLKEIKIASGIMLNLPLLKYLNEHAEIIFLSTGMATIPEIKEALSHLNKVKKCYILHCVTQYPCKEEDANLLTIKTLQREFPDYEIGYSDHTIGYLAPILAVSLGAKVIEKHFTYAKNAKEGTDHILSVEPDELRMMITTVRKVEMLLGKEAKEPTLSERKIKDFVRNRFT